MKNLFIPVFIIALVVGLGCSKSFFDEKSIFGNQEKSIVGKWWGIKNYDPESRKWNETPSKDFVFEFHANGDFGTNIFGYSVDSTYTVDTKSEPKRIILTNKKDKSQIIWIYKFEGERLITKSATHPKYGVAKDFSLESNFTIAEFERK